MYVRNSHKKVAHRAPAARTKFGFANPKYFLLARVVDERERNQIDRNASYTS